MKRPLLVVRNVLVWPPPSLNKPGVTDGLLLGLRADVRLWELPGGKVDDETLLDASRREQKEETGMQLLGVPKLVGYADCTGTRNPEKRFVDVMLWWENWRGEAMLAEPGKTLAWRWFPLDQVHELPLMQSTKHFVEFIMPTLFPGCIQEEPC